MRHRPVPLRRRKPVFSRVGGGEGLLIVTGGNTPPPPPVVEVTKERVKIKKVPKLPNIDELSDIGIVFLMVKILDQFRIAFPGKIVEVNGVRISDETGIDEGMCSQATESYNCPELKTTKQHDYVSASGKFASAIFPILIAINTSRPSMKEDEAAPAISGEDTMKFVYAYSQGGLAGRRYINTKFLYDMLDSKISQTKEVFPLIASNIEAFNESRAAFNSNTDVNAKALADWSDVNSDEYRAMTAILASSKAAKTAKQAVIGALAEVARYKASQAAEEVKDSAKKELIKFFKWGSKAGSIIQKNNQRLILGLNNFQSAFAASQPPGGTLANMIDIGRYTTTAALAGLKGLSEMNTSNLLKYAGLAMLGLGAVKKNWYLAGAGAVAAFIGYRQSAAAATPAATPPKYALRRLPSGQLVRVQI